MLRKLQSEPGNEQKRQQQWRNNVQQHEHEACVVTSGHMLLLMMPSLLLMKQALPSTFQNRKREREKDKWSHPLLPSPLLRQECLPADRLGLWIPIRSGLSSGSPVSALALLLSASLSLSHPSLWISWPVFLHYSVG